MAAIPVPPPLPPKSSFKTPDLNADTGDNTQLPDPEVEALRLWRSLRTDYQSGIFSFTPVRPVLQSGPTCGLVALAMAIDSLGLRSSVTTILSEAQRLGFTRQGEIMSVHNMKCLCEQLFPVTAVLTFGVRKNVSLLVDHLARGSPVILPYDCDANHTPTLRNGKRAHWAVILGFLLASRDLNGHQTQQPIHLTPPLSPDQLSYVRSCCSTHDLFLYARQGKSRFLQLWRFEDLCDSNENLLQVSDKLNSTSHVLPENGDLSHSLADQLLLIEPVSVCK